MSQCHGLNMVSNLISVHVMPGGHRFRLIFVGESEKSECVELLKL